MPVPIAELFISVSADVSAAISGLNGLETRLGTTTQAFRDATPAALLLAGAGAAIGAGFVSSIKTAADFEHQMSGVRAVMSTDDIKQFGSALDALALKLGADTAFTAREAAAGIEELIKAGVPAQAVLEGAGAAALNLAAATGTDVATAATIAAQAMNAFKVPVSELPTLVDRLAGVVNVSAADMSDLRFGLQAAGAVAATVGLSFTDTAAAIGIFANNGLRGQDAGTSLKTMLINLVPNTKAQTDAFKNLGLITADGANAFFDARGKVKSLADISGVLQGALKGMTDQQKLAALQVLFGTDAMRAAAILARTGADGVNQFTAAVQQVSAADQAAERLNNLLGRLEQLGGSFQTVQIIIGRFFLPAISGIADRVKEVLNAFSSLSPGAQGVITAIAAVAGVLAGATGGLTLLSVAVRTLAPSFLAVGKVLLALAPAFRLVALVAGALAFAWATNLGDIRGIVQRAFDAIPGILDRVASALAAAGALWQTVISPALQRLSDFISTKFGNIFTTIANSPVGQAIGHIFDAIGTVFNAIITGNGQQVIDFFKASLPQAFKDLGASIEGPLSTVFDVIDKIFRAIITGNGQLVIDFFKANLPQAFKDLGASIEGPVGNAFDVIEKIFSAIISGNGQLVIDFFKANLPQAMKDLGAALEGPANALGGFAAGAGEGFKKFFTETLPPVLDSIGNISGDVGAGLKKFFTDTLPPVLGGIGAFAQDAGTALLAFFSEKIPLIIDGANKFAGDVGAGMTTFFTVTLPPVLTAISSFAGDVAAGMMVFFREHLPAVADLLDRFRSNPGAAFIQFFRDDIPLVIATAKQWTADTTAGLVEFFKNKAPGIIDGMAGFTPQATQNFLAFFMSFDNVKAQLGSLQPLFASLGAFFQAFANFEGAIANLEQRAVGKLFGELGAVIESFAGKVGPAAGPIAQIGSTFELLGTRLSGATAFFSAVADALNALAKAILAVPFDKLPSIHDILNVFVPGAGLLPIPGSSVPGGDIGGAGSFTPAAFNPNGGGSLISIGQLIISSEAEAEAFLARMAAAIAGATGRVAAPPDNSGNPALSFS